MATTTTTRRGRRVSGRTLMYSVLMSVVLFIVAAPLGDSTHGIGAHHHVVAVIGQTVFVIFLVSVLVFLALVLMLLAQTVSRRRA